MLATALEANVSKNYFWLRNNVWQGNEVYIHEKKIMTVLVFNKNINSICD